MKFSISIAFEWSFALLSFSLLAYENPTPAGLSIKSTLEFRHQLLLLRAKPYFSIITGPKPWKVKIIDEPPGPPFIYNMTGS